MWGWIAQLFAGGAGSIIKDLGGVADKFITTEDEKQAFLLETEKVITARLASMNQVAQTEMQSKADIMVAEVQSKDTYTSRTRPMILRWGLYAILFNYCAVPLIQTFFSDKIEPFLLPQEFWLAWGGAVAVYTIGRSTEKVSNVTGAGPGQLVRAITGTKIPSQNDSILAQREAAVVPMPAIMIDKQAPAPVSTAKPALDDS